MKYNENNKPIVCMMTQSTCYQGTTQMEIKGVLWHSTGANNPTLKRYVQPDDNAPDKDELLALIGVNKYKNDFNHITRQAGLNAWVGKLADGTIASVQSMPWDFKPWGCGTGKNGSCNNGWIQFEICEDGLEDKEYFDKVYAEACELTAYLCVLFNIDPLGTADCNGIEVPTILCHRDSYKLGLGSNHGDVNHWFPKFGKSMETVRNDVMKLMPPKEEPKPPVDLYYVRKTWEDAESEIGAFADLEEAKSTCEKAGTEYEVYDKNGVAVYAISVIQPVYTFEVGDTVSLVPGATYYNGVAIPKWVFGYKLYVRQIYKNGNVVISTQPTGAVTGVVKPEALVPYVKQPASAPAEPAFEPYLGRVNTAVLNVRVGAGTNYKISTQVRKNEVYTIVDEKNGWGKLKSGAGWVSLQYIDKVK